MRKLRGWQHTLIQIGLGAVAIFVLMPIWWMTYMAFDSSIIGWPTSFRLWPEQPSLEIFARVWERPSQDQPFLGLLKNSLLVSGGAAVLSLSLGASMAYSFARHRFKGRQAGLFALLVGALLPPVALMVPLYVLLTAIGLRTSLFGLTIVYTSFAMPFCIWNMRAAFQAVPNDVVEAAFLDGAGEFKSFWYIILPLALPSIGVAGLIAFLIGYSEFAMGWLFVERSQNVTLAMAISQLGLPSLSNMAALAVMMSTPVVVIFILFQRYFLDRLLFGAISER